MTTNPRDREFMLRAVGLAAKGFPAPNPRVGCVLTRENRVVGEGWHHAAGTPHAEVHALLAAGDRTRGATAYVTLEPCHHHGRTPPCSHALVDAGVTRVVFAVSDPNPKAAGGLAFLRSKGVEVTVGVASDEAEAVNHVWLTAMRLGRPFVTLKTAITADGFMARPDGSSQWITGPEARAEGHRLRAEMGAVLVGWKTVKMDGAKLTARVPDVERPVTRIVLDPRGHLKGDEPLFQEPGEIGWLRAQRDENLPWSAQCILERLWEQGMTSLLVEGGPTTLRAFLAEGLADELHLFVGQKTFGEGKPWSNNLALDLPVPEVEHFGGDVRLRYRWG
ncbi:MAG: bifunctional diaminohydroxyphosphoribosylaminopyrimidine deaminase/5-amino-6-(5-phosphoribosylamino)uracil reductase RibD [Fimbriimonadaceae bacterium]|nr:bifunctional diaminohydroxyphosphoribosylaminopyrimidine deaminase/5-amino-6-(5-phosphoribosylamino)uracil reductase RibD [Fimbriimonadaceae bacterium]